MELQAAALPAALRGEAPWEYEGKEVTQDGVDERGVHTMVAQGMYVPTPLKNGGDHSSFPLFSTVAEPARWSANRYAYAVQRWLDAGFSPSQFLLLTTDELAERPAEMMRKVERFLGLPVREPEPKPAPTASLGSHHES